MGYRSFSFLLTFFLFLPFITVAQLDTVITKTGETFIGTVERINKAVLTFDSKSGDSDYKIEWKQVKSINTVHEHRVIVNKKQVIIARFEDKDPNDSMLTLVSGGVGIDFPYEKVLNAKKIDDDFWGKLDADINMGYNFAKSTKTHQLTLRTSVGYLTDRWGVDGFYDEFFSLIDTVQSSRTEAALNTQYILPSAWYWEASANWFSSDEQEIALRTTYMAGFGRYLLNDPVKYLQASLGLALNRENFQQSEISDKESFEAFLKSSYVLFDHKYFGINSSFTGFLNLDDTERYRSTFNVDFTWDIGDSFDLVWGYSINYDSKPPNGGQQSDYVISLTIGWEL